VFGCQVVANENDEVMDENPRLLIGATRLGLHEIVAKTHELGGLSLSCHVDRPAYGIINQLGFIPPDLALDGVEVSCHIKLAEASNTIAGIKNYCCITNSDAHFLDDVGVVSTVFYMAEPTLAKIRKSLLQKDRRRILI
jgi:PHP family Zn ribbon phosphoesterase